MAISSSAISNDYPGLAIQALSVAGAALADSGKATLKAHIARLKGVIRKHKRRLREQTEYQGSLLRSLAHERRRAERAERALIGFPIIDED